MTMVDREAAQRELAERIQGGADQRESFRLLFDLYYADVHRFFSRRGLSPEDSLDLTQETFLAAYKSLASFRNEASLRTWVLRIATYIYFRWLRQRRSAQSAGSAVPFDESLSVRGVDRSASPPPQHDPLDTALRHEEERRLRQAIETLPNRMRQAVLLRVSSDLTHREIAELQGVSIETVKGHLFHARARLRKLLARDFASLGPISEDEAS